MIYAIFFIPPKKRCEYFCLFDMCRHPESCVTAVLWRVCVQFFSSSSLSCIINMYVHIKLNAMLLMAVVGECFVCWEKTHCGREGLRVWIQYVSVFHFFLLNTCLLLCCGMMARQARAFGYNFLFGEVKKLVVSM